MGKEIIHVILTAAASLIVLFILTKIMGNRQMSQLSVFDYINGITIGSIAAEMATSIEDFYKPLTAMIVYGLLAAGISLATDKSIKVRRFVTGETMILYDNGKLYEKNFKRAKLDLNEFLTECRNSGYFNLADIQTAILESNGKISFLPLSIKRPVTPEDMNLSPQQEKAVVNVIVDGKVLKDNLKFTGNNEKWLEKELHNQGVKQEDVFLATCDSNNALSVYVKIDRGTARDMFE